MHLHSAVYIPFGQKYQTVCQINSTDNASWSRVFVGCGLEALLLFHLSSLLLTNVDNDVEIRYEWGENWERKWHTWRYRGVDVLGENYIFSWYQMEKWPWEEIFLLVHLSCCIEATHCVWMVTFRTVIGKNPHWRQSIIFSLIINIPIVIWGRKWWWWLLLYRLSISFRHMIMSWVQSMAKAYFWRLTKELQFSLLLVLRRTYVIMILVYAYTSGLQNVY